MKEQKMMFPNHYAVIGTEEMMYIAGGIGPATLDDGKYDAYEKAGTVITFLEDMFNRIFKPDYSDRQAINKGLAGIGIIQTIISVFKPTAIAEAINVAPILTGILDTLGKIGLSRI